MLLDLCSQGGVAILATRFPFAFANIMTFALWVARPHELRSHLRFVLGFMREQIPPFRLSGIVKWLFTLRFRYGHPHDLTCAAFNWSVLFDTAKSLTFGGTSVQDDVTAALERREDQTRPAISLLSQRCVDVRGCQSCFSIIGAQRGRYVVPSDRLNMLSLEGELGHWRHLLSSLDLFTPTNLADSTHLRCCWRWAGTSTYHDVGIFDILMPDAGVLGFTDEFWPLEALREAADQFARTWLIEGTCPVMRTLHNC